ncbi:hypothetical protein BDN72DRAFT_906882 [Pluteus cervinus]|uniref:Uncharacterized protein n=1 Tax=Pluteus cervinus TaxID=181527 RepID=A0ACD2ZY74_9AGAR|nr:hypothetical protein BDN72DRAFT_906882 [Pluteus cervinus]
MSEQVSDSTQRVISIPELLRNIFFSLPRLCDTYHSALVCRTWSEIALDALWYEVDDLCILLNLLVPLTTAGPGFHRKFIRCPIPEDWIHFERYSRRVRTLLVDYDTPLPAQSVFAEIGRTRIRPEILPNLWSLHLFGDNYLCAIFLHSGIRDLAVHLDLSLFERVSFFLHHARFFSRSLVTLEIRTGRIAGSDPHPVGCIATGLSSWLLQLQDLEELTLPRFWNTTYVCKVLSQLPRLSYVGFEYYERNGYGNPIDTLTFNPMHSEADRGSILFPSLISFSQNAPFSESIQFITSWQHSSRLTDLILESQILETPDSFRSGLLSIADGCPLLSKLGLACLITTYLDHPGVATPSRSRITLDVLLPLHKLNHLLSFEIAHTLPIALTDDDFVALVKPWHKLERLGLGPDPYPFGSDNYTRFRGFGSR